MPIEHDAIAPPLGFSIPTVRKRIMARAAFVPGIVGRFDSNLSNSDSADLEIGQSDSGFSNGVYVRADSARRGAVLFVAEETIGDNQPGFVVVRGRTKVWVSGTGSAGDKLTVGVQESGNRYVAIALESWSAQSLIDVLFDGERGFGCYMAVVEEDYPVVNITSPEDGAEFTVGDSITFTATATDATDGDVSSSLDWESDIDGTLATNDASFSTSSLTVGIHTITATAQDSSANEGSDSIIITVNPTGGGGQQHDPPSDGGGAIDLE